MNAAKDKIKDNGKVFIATDASPRPGTDLNGAVNALKARSITASIILSGDCSSVPGLMSSTQQGGNRNNGIDEVPFSDNSTSSTMKKNTGSSGNTRMSNFSAIEAFSFMARETGGTFAFIPEVNLGGSANLQRYENTAFNIIQGAIDESLAFAQPNTGPRGNTFSVKLTGANTQFDASTNITFSGTGISVTSIQVLSPNELDVLLDIDPSATLGFRDVTATTTLSDGTMETAIGEGTFEVLNPSSSPTILSISPPAAVQGDLLTVNVFGGNTNFDASSVLNLGSGISIRSTQAISPTQLEAEIKIAADAIAGFRSIVVTTGGEVAVENVIGPFFVSLSTVVPCDALPLIDIVQAELPDFCQGETAVLNANILNETDLALPLEYLWNTGETSATASLDGNGTYTVEVTDANGCSEEATFVVNNFDRTNLVSSYSLVAFDGILMSENTVLGGGIGTLNPNSKISLTNNTMVTSTGTFAKAPYIEVEGNSEVTTTFPNALTVNLPLFKDNTFDDLNDITVPANTSLTLTGDHYGRIEVEENASLVFSGQEEVYIKSLQVRSDADLEVDQCTYLYVKNKVKLEKNAVLNSQEESLVIFAGRDIQVWGGSQVSANMYTTKDLIVENPSADNPTIMKGMFIADFVNADKNVFWAILTNCEACGSAFQNAIADNRSHTSAQTNLYASGLHIRPNPANTYVDIQMEGFAQGPILIELYDLLGQRIYQTFTINTLYRMDLNALGLENGVYLLSARQKDQRYTHKLLIHSR
ncbi:MAG: T9SS type A sorting domain-containing protein [Bacteroidota bacterium]